MPEISQVTRTADYAAAQSDRWLFIAALIVLGIVVVYVARYFVKQYEGLVTDFRQDRHKYEETLLRLTQEQGAMTKDLAVVLDRNTKVMEACNEELRMLRMQEERRRMAGNGDRSSKFEVRSLEGGDGE